jgi:beta-1,4-N-acetylglucosaminyltransferase
MSPNATYHKQHKVCLITVGATAPFDALIEACFEPNFLKALIASNYTNLIIQYGKDRGALFEQLKAKSLETVLNADDDLSIEGFDFRYDGLQGDMIACKARDSRAEGLVISHAGKFRL